MFIIVCKELWLFNLSACKLCNTGFRPCETDVAFFKFYYMILYNKMPKPNGKIDCDKAISITATIITMSSIIGYFIYLAYK